MRIHNRTQLQQLRVAYAQLEGALHVARTAQQAAEALGAEYLSRLSLVVGEEIPPGVRVSVDFKTGEVTIGESNGVAV